MVEVTPCATARPLPDRRRHDDGTIGPRPEKTTIVEIDAVRGFALCGIHVVNVYQQVVFPAMYGELPAEWAWRCITWWRKMPIRR